MKFLVLLFLLQDTGVYRVGNGVTAPTIISKVDPEYTEPARAAKVQGTVVLEAIISEDGIPHVMKVVQSAGYGLDESATKALEKWQFHPALKEGKPVKVLLNVDVNFNIAGVKSASTAPEPIHAAAYVVAVDPESPNTMYSATRLGV